MPRHILGLDHPLLIRLVRDGYAAFALAEREQAGLPPYAPLALVPKRPTNARRTRSSKRRRVSHTARRSQACNLAIEITDRTASAQVEWRIDGEVRPSHAGALALSLTSDTTVELRWLAAETICAVFVFKEGRRGQSGT